MNEWMHTYMHALSMRAYSAAQRTDDKAALCASVYRRRSEMPKPSEKLFPQHRLQFPVAVITKNVTTFLRNPVRHLESPAEN